MAIFKDADALGPPHGQDYDHACVVPPEVCGGRAGPGKRFSPLSDGQPCSALGSLAVRHGQQ